MNYPWTFKLEFHKNKMRQVATHKETGHVIASTWWWVDDGSAECECAMRIRAWEVEQAKNTLNIETTDD